jgi:hypothetical protein
MPNKITRDPEEVRKKAIRVAREVAAICGPDIKEANDIRKFRGQPGDPMFLMTSRMYGQANPANIAKLRAALTNNSLGNIRTELTKGKIMF